MPVTKEVVQEQLELLGDFHHLFTRGEVRSLHDVLAVSEQIHALTSGIYEKKNWLIVITDLRLIFLDKGLLFGLKQLDLPLSQISSISSKTGLFLGELQVGTSSGGRTISNIPKKDVMKICSVISGLMHGSPSASEAIVAHSSDDFTSQLERLAKLHDVGHLSDEEFRLAKAKLIQ